MRKIAFGFTLAAACLAATPVLAGDAKVMFNDLDLSTQAGKTELDHRIEVAAQQVCKPEAMTGSRIVRDRPSQACLVNARSEIAAMVEAKTDRLAKPHASAVRAGR
jgi:UrcA family protein